MEVWDWIALFCLLFEFAGGGSFLSSSFGGAAVRAGFGFAASFGAWSFAGNWLEAGPAWIG
jgi:hypothetical protein